MANQAILYSNFTKEQLMNQMAANLNRKDKLTANIRPFLSSPEKKNRQFMTVNYWSSTKTLEQLIHLIVQLENYNYALRLELTQYQANARRQQRHTP